MQLCFKAYKSHIQAPTELASHFHLFKQLPAHSLHSADFVVGYLDLAKFLHLHNPLFLADLLPILGGPYYNHSPSTGSIEHLKTYSSASELLLPLGLTPCFLETLLSDSLTTIQWRQDPSLPSQASLHCPPSFIFPDYYWVLPSYS